MKNKTNIRTKARATFDEMLSENILTEEKEKKNM